MTMPKSPNSTATAFAPATVANVAVGFDILGFSMNQAGDEVTVSVEAAKDGKPLARCESITGIAAAQPERLPRDGAQNTATVALQAMIDELKLDHGFKVSIKKGIPLGSGMGGSAASAVGAVVAANALLAAPLPPLRLLDFALAGEAIASGSAHADNVAPCLFGGLTLALSLSPLKIVPIPTPPELMCVLVHPHLAVETRYARSILKPTLLLQEHVHQSARLGAFVSACHSQNLELLQDSMIDLLIEPQRASLIPGFYDAKSAAIEQGAIALSISGSGPSVFAWTASHNAAERVRAAVLRAFAAQKTEADSWVAPVGSAGARLIAAS
jgi:homoserine kinase